MASVIELEGKDTDPETAKLVDVTEEIIVEPKLVRPETERLVEVTFAITPFVPARLVKKPLVDVTLVPVAVVNPNAPDNVPPVRRR
jgi:hypothetical protein